MESLKASYFTCPACGSKHIEVLDSYTVIDGSSIYKQETRTDENGKPFELAFRPMYQGNRTQFRCKDCGKQFESRIRDDEVETIKER